MGGGEKFCENKYHITISVDCCMFRPSIVTMFREVFFEGCITQNVKTVNKYKILKIINVDIEISK
jgi:hypothetical protein